MKVCLVVLLAIDVRNTHTVVGLLSGTKEHAKVVQQWRIRTESEDHRRRAGIDHRRSDR